MLVLAFVMFAVSPVAIDPGLGHVHLAVSTKNPEAQQFFDQGMAYLYGFNHEAAIRSFQKAANCADEASFAERARHDHSSRQTLLE